MSTLACVPITVTDDDAAIADAKVAAAQGADLVELRIDQMFSGDEIELVADRVVRIIAESPLPAIVTCRSAAEGGEYDGDEDARVALYERLGASERAEHPPRYLDFELASYTRSQNIRQKINLAVDHTKQQRDLKTSLILSMHDFKGRPHDLFRRLTSLREQPAAAVTKVAFLARSLRDALEALHLPESSPTPMISLAMGEFGLMSRVLAPKFGGFLTFASLRPNATTAPGQPTLDELLNVYNFRAIRRSTRVYGIAGWPVSHSLSPRLHNAGFRAIGHDGVYLPLPIAAGDDEGASYASFKGTILELLGDATLNFAGCSVTLPHKVNLLRLAREQGWEIDPLGAEAGAANTLVVENGATRVFNSDITAIVACVARAKSFARALVLGAGGAARAAAVALRSTGARVRISARDAARSASLCADLGDGCETTPWEQPVDSADELVVNCTPVGMRGGPAPEASPLGPESLARLSSSAVVFDTVYTPRETPLIRAARDAGLETISGERMFLLQASAQFQAWTGQPLPELTDWRVAGE